MLLLGAGGTYAVVIGGSSPTTFNPSDKGPNISLTPDNLTVSSSSSQCVRSIANYSSGKYYLEYTIGASNASAYSRGMGIANASATLTGTPAGGANEGILWMGDALFYRNSGNTTTGLVTTNNDVTSMAVDLDNNRIWYRRNGGNWNNNVSNDPVTNVGGITIATNPTRPVYVYCNCAASGATLTANFGATAYTYTAPSGFGNW